jgi:hypothetical protein
MPPEQPAVDDAPVHHAPVQDTTAQDSPVVAREAPAYAPSEDQEEWLEDAGEELPRRPRRRLLGAGGNPILLALLGVLLTACGFIGGVLVEKGQTSSGTSASGGAASLASRLQALRGATSGTSTSSSGGAGTGGFPGTGAGSGAGRPVSGQVAYLAGSTLYVTNSEGNTVKVTTSPATSVTKTVKASVKGIHPGETVTVTGATSADGAVSAESISVGSGGALAALFGGARSGGSGGATGGGPALFGSGG